MQLHVTDLAYMATTLVVLALGITLNTYDFQKCEPCATSPTMDEYTEEIDDQDYLHSYSSPQCGPYVDANRLRSNFIHWMPDGSSLIFNEKESDFPYDGGIIKIADAERAQHRNIVDANPYYGFGVHSYTSGDPYYGFKYGFHADLSPDGSTVVYSSCQFTIDEILPDIFRMPSVFYLKYIDEYIDMDENHNMWGPPPWRHYEIATVDVDGGAPRRLTRNNRIENYPVWSPDGTKIAFLSTEESRFAAYIFRPKVLYTMDEDGSNVRDIASSEKIDAVSYLVPSPPVWSPDGQWLAFLAYESFSHEGRKDLYVIRADGTGLRRIAEVTSPASWSPDSQRLAFAKIEGEYSSLYVSDPYGVDAQLVTPSGNATMPNSTISQVYWSPDGSEILFIASKWTVSDSKYSYWYSPPMASLYLTKPDGSELRTLADELRIPGAHGLPYTVAAWSPDSSRIAVRADWENEFEVIVISRDGSEIVTVVSR